MRVPRLFLLLLFTLRAAPAYSGSDASLENARSAQALLGPAIWSAVIRIENRNRQGPYPRIVHALVFEVARTLWFYCDRNGTQSLSQHIGITEREKQNLTPLLQAIDPGFTRWQLATAPASRPPAARIGPPNACFINSVAAWLRLLASEPGAQDAMLLSYYEDTLRGREGHTVLAYADGGALRIIDPDEKRSSESYAPSLAAKPLELARMVAGTGVKKARVLPLPVLTPSTPAAWASVAQPALRQVQGG